MTRRGFPEAEYRDRLRRAQAAMAKAGIDALLLTTEVEFRYFAGFLTRFWQSPTRVWFLILPASGDPIAVIPTIGVPLMRRSWVTDIRSWVSPDQDDDGLHLVLDAVQEAAPGDAVVAVPDGPESRVGLPFDVLAKLRVIGDGGLTQRLRQIKSDGEIARIHHACQIAGRAFERVPEIAHAGVPLDEVFRRFQMLCLEEGADWVGYLAGGAGPDGYSDVISPATNAPLNAADILMLDTGVVYDGYFCDVDRNFALSQAHATARSAYDRLMEATAAGFAAAKPGTCVSDLYRAMDSMLKPGAGPGRLGHGLGMDLTEGMSIIPTDHTPLEPGMVICVESYLGRKSGGPGVKLEDQVLITETGYELLTTYPYEEVLLS
jgi:Xaa-Pro aminopeptidase